VDTIDTSGELLQGSTDTRQQVLLLKHHLDQAKERSLAAMRPSIKVMSSPMKVIIHTQ
jgi:hypothetical protein